MKRPFYLEDQGEMSRPKQECQRRAGARAIDDAAGFLAKRLKMHGNACCPDRRRRPAGSVPGLVVGREIRRSLMRFFSIAVARVVAAAHMAGTASVTVAGRAMA